MLSLFLFLVVLTALWAHQPFWCEILTSPTFTTWITSLNHCCHCCCCCQGRTCAGIQAEVLCVGAVQAVRDLPVGSHVGVGSRDLQQGDARGRVLHHRLRVRWLRQQAPRFHLHSRYYIFQRHAHTHTHGRTLAKCALQAPCEKRADLKQFSLSLVSFFFSFVVVVVFPVFFWFSF